MRTRQVRATAIACIAFAIVLVGGWHASAGRALNTRVIQLRNATAEGLAFNGGITASPRITALHRATATLVSFRTRRAQDPDQYNEQRIPPIIHQVYGLFGDGPPPSKVEFNMNSFKVLNPNHTHIVWGPQDLDAMVQQYWPAYWSIYSQLQMPVLKADLARYMLVSTFGGVYSDVDTVCLKPVDDWGDRRSSIGMIIGIEVDTYGIHDWQKSWGRELQFCQWTFAAAPSHPLLSMVIHRSFQLLAAAGDVRSITDAKHVCDLTGPYLFTDVVDQYLQQQGYDWRRLLGHNREELVGDLYILSITGFSPGVGHMGARSTFSRRAKVQHQFTGAWKSEEEQRALHKQPESGMLSHDSATASNRMYSDALYDDYNARFQAELLARESF